MAASFWGLGWAIHQCTVGDPTLSSVYCACCEEPKHGRKSRNEQRTIGMYAAHNPLSWRVLSVAGRWLGAVCVLGQSTTLSLRWYEAVVEMGLPHVTFVFDGLPLSLSVSSTSGAVFPSPTVLLPAMANFAIGSSCSHTHNLPSSFCHILRSYVSAYLLVLP